MIVLVLTVCLVTGLAGAADPAFAVSSSKSPFANTKSSYQHNGRFDGNLIVHGVDVSYFQSMSSDWNKAKRNQCDYAIMRVTYTTYGNGSLNVDSKFATHFTKARAAGVMRGVYVFSQAKNAAEAEKEAQYAINRLKALGIGPKDLELPLYMDYEFAGRSSGKNKGRLYGLTKAKAIEAVNAFANVVRANGYDPGVYANTNFFKSYPVGTGKNDNTPRGDFIINLKQKEPIWYKDNSKPIPYGDPENALGTRWMAISSPGFGIHGTWEPDTVGKASSAGCVRMKNEDVEELYSLVKEGTVVHIHD